MTVEFNYAAKWYYFTPKLQFHTICNHNFHETVKYLHSAYLYLMSLFLFRWLSQENIILKTWRLQIYEMEITIYHQKMEMLVKLIHYCNILQYQDLCSVFQTII